MLLDQSHRVLLENFATFQRAQLCFEEVEKYIQNILTGTADELSALYAPDYTFYRARDSWDYLQTRAYPNCDGTGLHLISVGIEKLSVSDLLRADGSEAPQAFIYSELINDTRRARMYGEVSRGLRTLRPPDGFQPAAPHLHGYLFVKQLDSISAGMLCDSGSLKTFFRTPLEVLASWLSALAPELALLSANCHSRADGDA